jgi:hypothetical protein
MSAPLHPSNDDHRRNHARLGVGIAARLETIHGMTDVSLVNISRSGAKIDRAQVPKVRQAVLYWLGFEALGDVVWRDSEQLGMTFEVPLSVGTLLATRDRAPTIFDDTLLQAAREWATGDYGERSAP